MRLLSIVSSILGMTLAGTLGAGAQVVGGNTQQGANGTYTMSVSSKLVIEAVNVKDKQGKAINGLTAKDFTVTEDGIAQKVTFCEYQELPVAPPAPLAKPAPENIKVYNRLSVTQIAAEKPGDVKYKDRRSDCDVLRPDGDAAGGQAAGAGGGTEVYPDADDVVGPGVDSALYGQLDGCAAGLHR